MKKWLNDNLKKLAIFMFAALIVFAAIPINALITEWLYNGATYEITRGADDEESLFEGGLYSEIGYGYESVDNEGWLEEEIDFEPPVIPDPEPDFDLGDLEPEDDPVLPEDEAGDYWDWGFDDEDSLLVDDSHYYDYDDDGDDEYYYEDEELDEECDYYYDEDCEDEDGIVYFTGDDDTLRAFWLGNNENPHLQLDPPNTGWHGHTMRVFFRPSTPGEVRVYGPGEVEIRIPSNLMERRDGVPHGEFYLSMMQMPNSPAADLAGLGFHFVLEGSYIVLRNHRDVTSTEPFQFDIPFRYRPSNVPDGFATTIPIIVEYFGERARVERNDDLTLEFNNRLTLNTPQKLVRGTPYLFWQSVWGAPPVNDENYVFVVYDINIGHPTTTTQPFHTRLIERPQDNGEIVAWSPSRNLRDTNIPITSWTRGNTAQFNTNSPLTNWSRAGISTGNGGVADINSTTGSTAANRVRWTSVIVAYPRTGEPDQVVTNCVEWTVRGMDAGPTMDELLVMESLEGINHVYRHEICTPVTINDIGFEVEGVFGIGKTMGGTFNILPLFDVEGASRVFGSAGTVRITSGAYAITNGGTEPFRTQVIDDFMYLLADGVFHELNPEDYRFTTVWFDNFVEYVPIHRNDVIVGVNRLANNQRSPIRLYYLPLGSTEWVHFNTFNPGTGIGSPSFTIPAGSHAQHIMAVHDNGRYWVEFDMVFGFELFATDHVREIVADRTTVQVHNFANLQVFHYDDPERLYDIIEVDTDAWSGSLADVLRARDQATYGRYVLRNHAHLTLTRPNIVNAAIKRTSSAVTDASHGRQVISFMLDARTQASGVTVQAEQTALLRLLDIEIREGVFFDLLPVGSILDPDSVVARDMLGIIPHRLYTHENYRGSGQTLIEIHVETTAEFNAGAFPSVTGVTALASRVGTGFRVVFDVFYPWESIVDHGNNLRNVAAFQARDGALRGSALTGTSTTNLPAWADDASDHGSFVIRERELMSNLAPGATPEGERNTLYMQNDTTVPVNVATNAGFSKMIRATGDAQYSMHTRTFPGENYHYRLRFQNFDSAYTTNLIIFDVLEIAHDGAVPYWKGFFESIDVSQPISRGIAPVIYYSTLQGVNPVGNPAVYADLSNTAIWSTTPPANLDLVTAVAIDLTYDTTGGIFEIAPNSSIVVNIHMRAPVEPVDGPLAHNRASFSASLHPVGGGPSDNRSPAYSQVTTIELPDPELTIQKVSTPVSGTASAPTQMVAGEWIYYRISVTNEEERFNVRNIVVEDTIPTNLNFNMNNLQGYFSYDGVSAESQPLSELSHRVTATLTGRTIEWRISSLAPGETFTLVVPTRIDVNLTEATTFVNQAFITEINGREHERGEEGFYSEITYHEAEPRDVIAPTITKDACPIEMEIIDLTTWINRLLNGDGEYENGYYNGNGNGNGNGGTGDENGDDPAVCPSIIVIEGQYIRYTLTVTNVNPFDIYDHLVIDNLANGMLTGVRNVEVAVWTHTVDDDDDDYENGYYNGGGNGYGNGDEEDDFGEEIAAYDEVGGGVIVDIEYEYSVVRNVVTDFDELHVLFYALPANSSVIITFEARLDSELFEDLDEQLSIINTVYLYGRYIPGLISDDGNRNLIDEDDALILTPTVLNLAIEKISNPTTGTAETPREVLMGSIVEYSIVITNNGTEVVEDIIASDDIPEGLIIQNSGENLIRGFFNDDAPLPIGEITGVTYNITGNIITWEILELEVDNSFTIVIPTLVDTEITARTEFVNWAVIEEADGEDPNLRSNNTYHETAPPSLTKGVNRQQTFVGDELTYTLIITNPLSINMEEHQLIDRLRTDLVEFVPGTVRINGVLTEYYEFDVEDGELTVDLDILEPGETEVTFRVIVLPAAFEYGEIPNTAYLYGNYGQGFLGSWIFWNYSNVRIDTLELPTLTKRVSDDVAQVGDVLTYTLRVNNPNEDDVINDFLLVDILDTELVRFVAGSVRIGSEFIEYTFDYQTGRLEIWLEELDPGNTNVLFDVIVLNAAVARGEILNTAFIYGPPIPDPLADDEENVRRNRVDYDDADVLLLLNPTLTKSVDATHAWVGDVLRYTIDVINPNEDVYLRDFLVVDYLDLDVVSFVAGSVRVDGDAVSYTFNAVTGRLSVVLDELAPGRTRIRFEVVVIDEAEGMDVLNSASLYGPEIPDPTDDDPAATNREEVDVDDVEVVILEQPTLEKSANRRAVSVHGTIVYTLQVNNPNDIPINDFLVVDILDTDLVRFVAGSVRVDGAVAVYDFDSDTGRLSVEIAILQPGNTDITFTVNALYEAVEDGVIPNTAYLYGPYIPADDEEDDGTRNRLDYDDEEVLISDLPLIAKSVDYTLVLPGSGLRYTLVVTNPLEEDLVDHLVVDYLDLSMVSLVRGSLRVDGESRTYTFNVETGRLEVLIATLEPGDLVITFDVIVNLNADGDEVLNTAYLYGPNIDGIGRPSLDSDDADVEVLLFPTLTKVANEERIRVGDEVIYTLAVYNPNDIAISNFIVQDRLPITYFEFIAGSVEVNGYEAEYEFTRNATVGIGILTIEFAELVSGLTEITFVARALPASEGEVVRNTAFIFGPPGANGTRPEVADDYEDVAVEYNPIITKAACPIAPTDEARGLFTRFADLFTRSNSTNCATIVNRGQFISYTLTVTNPNDFNLYDYLVVDNLANGRLVDVRSVDVYLAHVDFEYDIVQNAITELYELRIILDVLPAETDVAITFEARIAEAVFDTRDSGENNIINSVYLFGPEDEDGNRNEIITPDEDSLDGFEREGDIGRDTATVNIPPLVSPALTKVANVESTTVAAGQVIEYVITVSNPNDVALGEHLVVDNLANGRLVNVTNLSVYPASIDYEYEVRRNTATNQYELLVTIEELPAEVDVVITFRASIAPGVTSGDINNRAYLFGGDLEDDPVEIADDFAVVNIPTVPSSPPASPAPTPTPPPTSRPTVPGTTARPQTTNATTAPTNRPGLPQLGTFTSNVVIIGVAVVNTGAIVAAVRNKRKK